MCRLVHKLNQLGVSEQVLPTDQRLKLVSWLLLVGHHLHLWLLLLLVEELTVIVEIHRILKI